MTLLLPNGGYSWTAQILEFALLKYEKMESHSLCLVEIAMIIF